MTKRTVLIRTAFAAVLALGLAACGDALTQENYDKLGPGMTVEEVEALLGKGAEADALTNGLAKGGMGEKKFEWRAGDKVLRITFKDGKLRKRSKQGF